VGISAKLLISMALLLAPAAAVAQSGGEWVLAEGTQLKLQLNDYLSTKLNNEGDAFTATVTEAVYIKERLAIPKGSTVSGSVSRVLRPGRFKGKAMMNLLFTSIHIPGAAGPLPMIATLVGLDPEGGARTQSEGTIQGPDSKGRDAVRVGAPTAGGAAVGGIVGGGKGAAIGAGVGAVIGLASVLSGRGKDLEIKKGSLMEIVLDRPLSIPETRIVLKHLH